MKIKNYKNSRMWIDVTKNSLVRPIIRLVREGGTNGGLCPHCHSSATYGVFGSIRKYFGAKKYCINPDCIYHYFDIRKEDNSLYNKNKLINFVKNREREYKFKRILKTK